MKENSHTGIRHGLLWSIVILIALGSFAAVIGSRAGRAPSISITITNNSTLEVRHVYLSPVDQENWGPDQLNDSAIAPGASATLNSVACDQASIKVIAEDQNGCFLYKTIECGADASWAITSSAGADCGN